MTYDLLLVGVRARTHTHTHTRARARARTHESTNAHTHAHTHTHKHTDTHTFVHTLMQTRTHTHILVPRQVLRLLLSGATRGVMVSTSAFLACHQCYCTGSSLAWGLNPRALVVAFSEARRQGFSPGTPVSSPTSSVNGSVNKIKLK